MNILLSGRGKMAHAMEIFCRDHGVGILRFGQKFDNPDSEEKTVAIHFGNAGGLMMLVELCERLKIPIIQGSTDVDIPNDRKVVIINAPNLALPMIRFVTAFPAFAKMIGVGMKVRIVESHQAKKGDKVSGTAKKIAIGMILPESRITSIREQDIQIALGIPEEHLDGHAFHSIIFSGQGVEISMTTKILGRKPYAEGALTLAKALVDQSEPLKNGVYQLEDILHLLPTK